MGRGEQEWEGGKAEREGGKAEREGEKCNGKGRAGAGREKLNWKKENEKGMVSSVEEKVDGG